MKDYEVVVGLEPYPDDVWLWDCNGNWAVEVGDAIALLRCVVGLSPWPIEFWST